MAKKILITGASGFVGNSLSISLSKKYKIVGAYHNNLSKGNVQSLRLDITDNKNVDKILEKENPDIIIHSAALKNVKECQANKNLAEKINVIGTKNIAIATKELNSFLIYISTDYVFDGKKGFYKENDQKKPWTIYGKTKLEGEKIIQKSCKKFSICRTSGIYGYHPDNILHFIINQLKINKKQSYMVDVFNSPTSITNFADMLEKVIEKNKNNIYHTAGSERINRYDFALKVAENFNLDKKLILPIELGKEKRKQELRPYDVSLDVMKSQSILGMEFLDVHEGLKQIKKTMAAK